MIDSTLCSVAIGTLSFLFRMTVWNTPAVVHGFLHQWNAPWSFVKMGEWYDQLPMSWVDTIYLILLNMGFLTLVPFSKRSLEDNYLDLFSERSHPSGVSKLLSLPSPLLVACDRPYCYEDTGTIWSINQRVWTKMGATLWTYVRKRHSVQTCLVTWVND